MTTGTYIFAYSIASVVLVGKLSKTAGLSSYEALTSRLSMLVITQLLDQVKIRFTSQFIRGIFSAFQKLLKCFNDTTILTSFVPIFLAS